MNKDYISLYPSLVNPGPSLELIIVFKPFKNTHFIMFFSTNCNLDASNPNHNLRLALLQLSVAVSTERTGR